MKTATGLVVLAIFFQSCQTSAQKESIELGESGDEHQYKHLRLFPVRANDAFLQKERKGSYLTLNEAVTQKKVLITERGDEIPQQQPAGLNDIVQTSNAGATPKLTISAIESNSRPKGESVPPSRARRPSRRSKTHAARMHQIAYLK